MRRALMTALAATILSTTTPVFAQSATVNGAPLSSGGSTTIHFGGPAGTTASADLFLMLTSADTTMGKYDFSYTFTNTNASVSDLTGFGFTTTPTLMGVRPTHSSGFSIRLISPVGTMSMPALTQGTTATPQTAKAISLREHSS